MQPREVETIRKSVNDFTGSIYDLAKESGVPAATIYGFKDGTTRCIGYRYLKGLTEALMPDYSLTLVKNTPQNHAVSG